MFSNLDKRGEAKNLVGIAFLVSKILFFCGYIKIGALLIFSPYKFGVGPTTPRGVGG